MKIIPAIDLMNNRCVRLYKGNFNDRTDYAADPLDVAKRFEDAGLRYLHLVDLDGARSGRTQHLYQLERIAAHTRLCIDYSGGLQCTGDAEQAFNAGAACIGVGSLALREPGTVRHWLQRWGAEAILLGADVREGFIAVQGWTKQTDLLLTDFLDVRVKEGFRQVSCTDISRDGTLSGPALGLYRSLRQRYPALQLIASGGIRSKADVCALSDAGCTGAVIGKALYEGLIRPEELSELCVS